MKLFQQIIKFSAFSLCPYFYGIAGRQISDIAGQTERECLFLHERTEVNSLHMSVNSSMKRR